MWREWRAARLLLVGLLLTVVALQPARATPSNLRKRPAAEGERRVGPPLTALRTKIGDPQWLVAWLLRPSRLRHRPFMRNFRITTEEAQALASWLYVGSAPPAAKWRGGDVRTGQTLFVTRGCRGCHAIGSTDSTTLAEDLAGIGIKVRADWLFNWLKSPRSYDPNTTMPRLTLSDEDIRDLVAFLLSHREGAEVVAASPRFRPEIAPELARDAIRRFDCAKCHLINGFQVIAQPTGWAAEPKGCADCHQSSDPSSLPSPRTMSVAEPNSNEAALQNGRRLVTYYGCRGCHRIEGSGAGIAEYLERKTLAPPGLDGEGARVQTSWLTDFLERPTNLRPWLEIRMPDYGLSHAEAVVLANYFAALARIPTGDEPRTAAPAPLVALGQRRFAHFKCLQCHPATPDAPLPEGVDPDDRSINLALARSRLRPTWIRDFLARPKTLVGLETRMPAVFYTTDGVAKVDDPDRDIAAISAYLLHMAELPAVTPSPAHGGAQHEPQIDWSTHPY